MRSRSHCFDRGTWVVTFVVVTGVYEWSLWWQGKMSGHCGDKGHELLLGGHKWTLWWQGNMSGHCGDRGKGHEKSLTRATPMSTTQPRPTTSTWSTGLGHLWNFPTLLIQLPQSGGQGHTPGWPQSVPSLPCLWGKGSSQYCISLHSTLKQDTSLYCTLQQYTFYTAHFNKTPPYTAHLKKKIIILHTLIMHTLISHLPTLHTLTYNSVHSILQQYISLHNKN